MSVQARLGLDAAHDLVNTLDEPRAERKPGSGERHLRCSDYRLPSPCIARATPLAELRERGLQSARERHQALQMRAILIARES